MKCTPADNHHLLSFQRAPLTPRRQQAWTPALIRHLSPPPHPRGLQPLLFQLSSMISHYETIPHMYPCLYPSCSITLTPKIQPSTFPTFAFAPLCWKNQQGSLPTHVWESEVGPEGCLPSHHTLLSSHSSLLFNPNLTASLSSTPQ